MAKLLLLVVVISMGSNWLVESKMSFSSMSGYMSAAQDIFTGVSDSMKMSKQGETTEMPEVNKQLGSLANSSKDMGATGVNTGLKDFKESTAIVTDNLNQVNDKVSQINEEGLIMLRKLGIILRNLDKVTQQLSRIPATVTDKMEIMLDNILKVEEIRKAMDHDLKKLWLETGNIDIWYKMFLNMTDPNLQMQDITYKTFEQLIISFKDNEMQRTIAKIHDMFTTKAGVSSIHDNLLSFVNRYQETLKFGERCDLSRSFQEQLRVIYNIVVVSELRVLMMSVFIYHRKRIYRRANGSHVITDTYKTEAQHAVKSSMDRMKGYLSAMKIATRKSSAEIFRCDEPNPIINDHVFRLDNLFGLYYFSVSQISSDCEVDDLRIIDYYGFVDILKSEETSEAFVKNYRPRFQCNGRLHNCVNGNKRVFCEAYEGSGKRYEWIDMRSTPHSDCHGRYVDTIAHSTCTDVICKCSEEGPESTATRAFNLIPQYSDIQNNRVVTNIRLRKKDNVVHIQVQQGELMSEGHINETTLEWVPLGKFIRNEADGFYWTDNVAPKVLVENEDYTFVTHDSAKFYLDDIKVEKGYIVTGVKFQRQELNAKNGTNKSGLRIKVHGTKFNYAEGTLSIPKDQVVSYEDSRYFKWFDSSSSEVISDPNYGRDRSELSMRGRSDSMLGTNNEIKRRTNEFIEFQTTAFETDFGQTTIPYFDARPAIELGGTSLGGIGIAFRGSDGYGGYIAPKVFSVNHAEYIDLEGNTNEMAWSVVEKLVDPEEEQEEEDMTNERE